MKIALVSFGHADSIISLARNLSVNKDIYLDLYYVFSKNHFKNNIIDLSDKDIRIGLKNEIESKGYLSQQINKYINSGFKVFFFFFYNQKIYSFTNIILSLKLSLKLRKYHIVHFNGTNGVLPWLIFFLFRKTLVFTIHDYHPHSGEEAKTTHGQLFNKMLMKYKIKSRHIAVIQNKTDFTNIVKNENKIRNLYFIPFGPLEIYEYFRVDNINSFSDLKSDLLLFGRISPYKGIEYLLKSFEKLLSFYPDLKLIIAGAGELHFSYNFDKYSNNIKFINKFIRSEDLYVLVKNTKLVVCPYTDATQSGVAMTAFALGKPVVASDVGGFSDVILNGVNGFLVEPKNSEALFNILLKVFSENNLIERLTQNIIKGQFLPEEFCWDNIATNYIKLYKSIIKIK